MSQQNMVEVNIADAIGKVLDWMVAKAVGYPVKTQPIGDVYLAGNGESWIPSTDWAQGGPLMEKHIGLCDFNDKKGDEKCYAESSCSNQDAYSNGSTMLVAAMRAIVIANLGDRVSVPAELAEQP